MFVEELMTISELGLTENEYVQLCKAYSKIFLNAPVGTKDGMFQLLLSNQDIDKFIIEYKGIINESGDREKNYKVIASLNDNFEKVFTDNEKNLFYKLYNICEPKHSQVYKIWSKEKTSEEGLQYILNRF